MVAMTSETISSDAEVRKSLSFGDRVFLIKTHVRGEAGFTFSSAVEFAAKVVAEVFRSLGQGFRSKPEDVASAQPPKGVTVETVQEQSEPTTSFTPPTSPPPRPVLTTVTATVSSEATTSTALPPEQDVVRLLRALDQTAEPIRRKVQAFWGAHHQDSATQIQQSPAEVQELAAARATLLTLSNSLLDRYPSDFGGVGWHGRASLQRILWQDKEVIEALKNPYVIKALLLNPLEGGNLGEGNTIGTLFFWSFKDNRLPFLMSAAPNWCCAPTEMQAHLLALQAARAKDTHGPRRIDKQYVEEIKKVLEAVQTVFAQIPEVPAAETDGYIKQVKEASGPQLMNAFTTLIDTDAKIAALTVTQGAASTESEAMANQCYEVMAGYDELLATHQNDDVAVLGYGIVSHGLDAKHLAAGLYMIDKDRGWDPHQLEGRARLQKLLQDVFAPTMKGSQASELLKIRLEQVFMEIIAQYAKLGLEVTDIQAALTPTMV